MNLMKKICLLSGVGIIISWIVKGIKETIELNNEVKGFENHQKTIIDIPKSEYTVETL